MLCIFTATYRNLEQVPRQASQWLLSVYTYMTLTVILFFAEKKTGFMFSLCVEFQCLSGRWNSVGSLEDSRRTRCVSPAPEVAQECQEESVLYVFFLHPLSCVVSETWASSHPTRQLPSQVPRWVAVLTEWVLHEPPSPCLPYSIKQRYFRIHPSFKNQMLSLCFVLLTLFLFVCLTGPHIARTELKSAV